VSGGGDDDDDHAYYQEDLLRSCLLFHLRQCPLWFQGLLLHREMDGLSPFCYESGEFLLEGLWGRIGIEKGFWKFLEKKKRMNLDYWKSEAEIG